MKIIHKNRIPLKYIYNYIKINSKSWDYSFEGCTKLNYWLNVCHCATDYINRRHNFVILAIDNNVCIGYLMAHVANKPKRFHPVLFFMRIIVCFLLSLTKQGREILTGYDTTIYLDHIDKTVQTGKYALAGMGYKKISTGISVAIDPQYRKSGLYKEMTRRLMEAVDGYFIFHTSTESVYKAHEKLGYKKIYEVPYPYPQKDTTFIMYGDKNSLKLEGKI